jgi:hypothetical protein
MTMESVIRTALVVFATLFATAPAPTASRRVEIAEPAGVKGTPQPSQAGPKMAEPALFPAVRSTSFHRGWTEFVR